MSDDSSSSDDDELLSFTPFTGASKRQRSSSPAPPSPPPPSQPQNDTDIHIQVAQGTCISSTNKKKKIQRFELDETEIEARRKVNVSFVPTRVNDPSQLYWNKFSRKKKVTWHPCRECHHDEGIGLDIPDSWDNDQKALVQYVEGTKFGLRALVSRKSLFPYHGNEPEKQDNGVVNNFNGTENNADCWCPEKLKLMSQCNRKNRSKEFSDEACVRAMELYMEKVLHTAIERMMELKEQQEAEAKKEVEIQKEWTLSVQDHDDDNDNAYQSPLVTNSAIISQSQEDLIEEGGNYSSSDDVNLLSQCQTSRKLPIRPGDIIQYYEPNQIFGDTSYLREAEVEEIDCKTEMVLRASGGIYLGKDEKVKLIKRVIRGKLQDFNGNWMYIGDYKLKSAKTIKNCKSGIEAKANELKKVLEKQKQEASEKLKEKGLEKFADFIR